ncbi:helix-turn-helix domain-containing protein [Paenibacillus sp. Soil522]|uniref:helix-turn-helix domain-containing protein n=1 Tax=Paenibacillus sp. Soil522 TaxID=1736388 RepID=UPI0006FFA984|nr:helix-turn-helix transcriptional regulator [Paenibacillus sp. Soil522]KRE45495.1 hypothetical protein ASG81_12835 [Paenibacillus sp. Soil522]
MDNLFDGEKLKNLRKSKGLSAKEVAEKLNISQGYISKFENNRAVPDINMLLAILSVLDTNISEFFMDSLQQTEIPPDLYHLIQACRQIAPGEQKALLALIREFKGLS